MSKMTKNNDVVKSDDKELSSSSNSNSNLSKIKFTKCENIKENIKDVVIPDGIKKLK